MFISVKFEEKNTFNVFFWKHIVLNSNLPKEQIYKNDEILMIKKINVYE